MTGQDEQWFNTPTVLRISPSMLYHLTCRCSLCRIWGIGLSPEQASRVSMSQWKGLNLLGKALVEVREGLKSLEEGSTGPSAAPEENETLS